MKILREIITNPFGIAVAIVHWIFVSFILFNDGIYQLKTNISLFKYVLTPHALGSYSSQLILVLNYIPYILVKAISKIIGLYFDKNTFLEYSVFLIFVAFSTLQWLLIGYFISQFISLNRALEKIKFSLKNE